MVVPVIAIAGVLLLFWVFQREMMYFPMQDVPTPGALGLGDVETVEFETGDGLRLSGWFFPIAGDRSRATVLVFNGNAGHRGHRARLASGLRDRGFQVLLMDYRGFGGNPETPSERGLAADARAARAYLARRPGVDVGRLVYFGESLGAAVAVELATEHPPAALILRSPFTSMADIGQHHYWWLPVRWFIRDRYPSLDRMPHLRSPLLVILGERDRIVPAEQSRRLYEAAAHAPKTLRSFPQADHNDLELFAGDEMIDAIAGFLEGSL
jgi:uncharacterized protein